jgi:hypothetical protein
MVGSVSAGLLSLVLRLWNRYLFLLLKRAFPFLPWVQDVLRHSFHGAQAAGQGAVLQQLLDFRTPLLKPIPFVQRGGGSRCK